MSSYLFRLLKSYFVDNIPDPNIGEYWAFCEDFNNPFDIGMRFKILDKKDGYVKYYDRSMSIRYFKSMYRKVNDEINN